MLNQNIIIIFVLAIPTAIIYYFAMKKEGFCNCTGMAARTANPTYYVYRPFGDVSNYGSDLNRTLDAQYISVGAEIPMAPAQNLGWKIGTPYDAFVSNSNGNSWAAGSDPLWRTHSSVPMLASGCASNSDWGVVHKSSNGGYATNYGSNCGANANNLVNGSQFIAGQYGYPNMLSNGTEYVSPAGPYTDSPCGVGSVSADAYNLGIGVL